MAKRSLVSKKRSLVDKRRRTIKHRRTVKHRRTLRQKNSRRHKRATTKRIFLLKKKQYRGGFKLNHDPNYPQVYGIDNKAVLYPVSKYGIPAGAFDPPLPSNGIGLSSGAYSGGGSPSSFFPQPLTDLGRSLTGSVFETINGFNGVTNAASLNPMPYNQPIDK
jgi:hypothetical protein